MTFDRLKQIGFGEMLMSEEDFLNCTPYYFRLRLHGMRKAQTQQYRNQWELSRWMAATMIAPHLKKPIAPQKLISFPWEVEQAENVQEVIEKYRHIFNKLTPPPQA